MRIYLILPILIGFLAGCEDGVPGSSGAFGPDVAARDADRTGLFGIGRSPFQTGPSASSRGDDTFFNFDQLDERSRSRVRVEIVDDQSVEITLLEATIAAAAEEILGNVLKKSFVIEEGVTGSVTIQSTGPVPKTALYQLFEASLRANGARIETEGDVLAIRSGALADRTFRSTTDGDLGGSTIVVAPLKYVSATQMLEILEPLAADGLIAIPDQDRNLVLLSGRSAAIAAAIDALNLFDVDVMRGKSIALVDLQAANPEDVVTELQAIFAAQEGGLLEGVIDFIPNSRMKSVLIVTSRSRYLDEARRWIRELDRTAARGQSFTRVYPLLNRKAEDIAPVLNQLLSDTTTSQEGEQGTTTASGARVAADVERNALIVRGERKSHEEVAHLLTSLDTRARQVALEATIAEVTLNDEISLGVRWFMDRNRRQIGFSDVVGGGFSQSYPGFSSLLSTGKGELVLQALAGVTDVQVISSPTLVVLDNREAVLQIGDQVPVATQTSSSTTSNDAPVVTTISYRDTGVILRVTPQIGAAGTVSLDVSQEVSSVANTNTSGIDSPTIRQRQLTTSVFLNDGSTLILGGLVQENNNRTDTKAPGLGDIPFLGAAFRNRTSRNDRTELLIMIRPRIILSASDANSYTAEWRGKLNRANAIATNGLGSPRHSIEDVFR